MGRCCALWQEEHFKQGLSFRRLEMEGWGSRVGGKSQVAVLNKVVRLSLSKLLGVMDGFKAEE